MELKMLPSAGDSGLSFRHSAMAASYWPLEANNCAFWSTVRRSTAKKTPHPDVESQR